MSAQAYIQNDPEATETQFLKWATDISAFRRYPELQGVGVVQIVLRSHLRAFEAHQIATWSAAGVDSGPFAIIPPGNRVSYCFASLGLYRSASASLPRGYDFCTGPGNQVLQPTGTASQPSLAPLSFNHVAILSLSVPTYLGGVTPSSSAVRERAFLGWVGVLLVPGIDLRTALAGHPGTAVTLRFGGPASSVVFGAGAALRGARTDTIELHNGWRVSTMGSVIGDGIFATADAIAMLFAGIALSLLLGALILVLGGGRTRAKAQLFERTRQLRFQALHDPLTGLPNRALILDRTQRMLARARRTHLPAAAMFLDLDDFKDINDTLGHQAGDQLLIAVSARLNAALRENDTVGRLGGDEFIVLVDGSSLNDGAETVASRILDALRPSFDIPGSDLPISLSASIGVAEGDRPTPDELLRDADIALYQAKAAGKNCTVVFEPRMIADAWLRRDLSVVKQAAADGA